MKRIERDKNRISAFRAVLSATGMLALIGCGRTVIDTAAEQQPTTTIETTVDDPVKDPVVEPTTDVSDNTTVVEPEEDKPDFSDATFIQTGENEYTINIDCPDNSNEILDPTSVPMYEIALVGDSNNYGVSSDLMNAIFTYGLQTDPSNPTQANIETYVDMPMYVNIDCLGKVHRVFTYDESQYPGAAGIVHLEQLNGDKYVSPNSEQCTVCVIVFKDALTHCNGNVTCALAAYNVGISNWDKVMQECTAQTGLTAEQIYANYDFDFVEKYDAQGLLNHDFVTGVLQYIGNEPIAVSYFDENGQFISTTTYTLDRVKTYGTI